MKEVKANATDRGVLVDLKNNTDGHWLTNRKIDLGVLHPVFVARVRATSGQMRQLPSALITN